MNTIEAITLLDNICAQVSLNRTDHVKVQVAVEVLRKATEPKKVKAEEVAKNGKKQKEKALN